MRRHSTTRRGSRRACRPARQPTPVRLPGHRLERTDEAARELLDVEGVRSLFVWHALEETEHKAVAFDVYPQVSGSHRVRAWVMNAKRWGFSSASLSLRRCRWSPTAAPGATRLRRCASVRNLRDAPWLARHVVARIRDYNRRGFHPDDYDNTALTAEWRDRLFGGTGTLANRVKPAATA